MPETPEERARAEIDRLLEAAGCAVQGLKQANIHAARGVAIREFPLNPGYGEADYLCYVDGKAAGMIEAKKEGATLTGLEVQSGRYSQGLPGSLPAWRLLLPLLYESTGAETHFTNGLDPPPRARNVFAFHRPETLGEWLQTGYRQVRFAEPRYLDRIETFLARVQRLPSLAAEWAGYYLDLRDKLTRKVRWEQLDEEFSYDPSQLGRDVLPVAQVQRAGRSWL